MRSLVCLALIGAAACRSSPAGTPPDGGGVCPNATKAGDGTLASIAPIVIRTCARAGCHDPLQHEHGMDLSTPDRIHENWVGKKGLDHCSNMALFRVVPGDPAASHVMTKIEATGPLCSLSNRMPPPPAEMLSACEIDAIRSWIAAGAPGPTGGADAGADAPADAVSDASDDGNGDANADTGNDAIEPGVCTSTQPCDPVSETCVEVMQSATGDCSMRWECYSHAPDDETVEHACPPEVATFCGCDGTMFDSSYACPNRPYDHIGSCGDGHSCDATRVRCADAAPTCPDGQAPAVTAGCWGPCVPIAMCRCDQNWQCPQRDRYRCSLLPDFRCGPIPQATDAGQSQGTPASIIARASCHSEG